MVEWTISNHDDESATISLQDLIYDQSVTSEEIRHNAKRFLANLERAKEKCKGS